MRGAMTRHEVLLRLSTGESSLRSKLRVIVLATLVLNVVHRDCLVAEYIAQRQ
jgi:hypothetical protein